MHKRLISMSICVAATAAIAQPVEEPRTYDATAVTATAADQLREMTALYRDACIAAFPDDDAVAALMTKRGARAMDEAEVVRLLHQDAGIGWSLRGRGTLYHVTIELPPYHACTVRSTTRAGFDDLAPYHALLAEVEKDWADVQHVPPRQLGGTITQEISGDGRLRPDGSSEMLILGVGRITDPEARAALPGVEVRFVHQIVAPARGG